MTQMMLLTDPHRKRTDFNLDPVCTILSHTTIVHTISVMLACCETGRSVFGMHDPVAYADRAYQVLVMRLLAHGISLLWYAQSPVTLKLYTLLNQNHLFT